MKRIFLSVISCVCFAGVLCAQMKIDTIYYDKDWKGVDHPSFATYYRITMTPNDPNYTQRYRDYWMDGTLQSEGQFISIDRYNDSKSILDGECTTYYKSGGKEYVNIYKDNATDRTLTHYAENGDRTFSAHLVNGKFDGVVKNYKNGKLVDSQVWKMDVREGEYNLWDNGKLAINGNYVGGVLDGPLTYYDDNGKPYYIATYDKGLKIREQTNSGTMNYTEFFPKQGKNNIRLSVGISTNTLSPQLVQLNDVTLNIMNQTDNKQTINIDNIQVYYVASTKEGKNVFEYNQMIIPADANWLYDAIIKNVNDGVEITASRIAKEGSTSTSHSSSRSNASVYDGTIFSGNLAAEGYSYGSSTTTHQDRALEYKIREKEGGTANAIKAQWQSDINRQKSMLDYNGIALYSHGSATRHILFFAEIHHTLASQVKGNIEQVYVAFDIDGASYSFTYDCQIPKLTAKKIEDRDDLMDDKRDEMKKYVASWDNIDYYVAYGAWYNYKTLIEAHTKNILATIKKNK